MAMVAACMAAFPTATMAQALPATDAEWASWVPDPATLAMPDLGFTETPEIVADYDKFFVFHRADTDFATALADVRECDGHARGLFMSDFAATQSVAAYQRYSVYTQGALGAVIGQAIGDPVTGALADAVYGSAEVRRKMRVNLRRCMFFKGYARFGLAQGVWNDFNSADSDGDLSEQQRQRLLVIQALVASGPRPQLTEVGL